MAVHGGFAHLLQQLVSTAVLEQAVECTGEVAGQGDVGASHPHAQELVFKAVGVLLVHDGEVTGVDSAMTPDKLPEALTTNRLPLH
ncbi:hypothetical protein [Streptomyces sp. NPDC002676]